MLSKQMILSFGIGLLFSYSTLQAEESITINLRDAIKQTFLHNPALRTFDYKLKAHRGRLLQAGLPSSPKLTLAVEDLLGTGDFKRLDGAQMTLGISWVLEGDIRQAHINVARAGAFSLSTEAKFNRLNAAAETARLYISVLANQLRIESSLKMIALAKETTLAVKKRVMVGKAPEAELARAEAELARHKLDFEGIEHELSSAIRQLAAQWGETKPRFRSVEGDLSKLPTILPFESLKAELEQSPTFALLVSERQIKKAQLSLAQSKSNSEWRVNIGVRHFEISNDQALVAGVAIPFGARSRNQGGIIEAQENLSQIEVKTAEFRVRFETTLYLLSEELAHDLHRVSGYRHDIIPRLEKALKETRRAYQLGRYSYLEWRTVQADLLVARDALIESTINAHLKAIEIERLTGASMAQQLNKQ